MTSLVLLYSFGWMFVWAISKTGQHEKKIKKKNNDLQPALIRKLRLSINNNTIYYLLLKGNFFSSSSASPTAGHRLFKIRGLRRHFTLYFPIRFNGFVSMRLKIRKNPNRKLETFYKNHLQITWYRRPIVQIYIVVHATLKSIPQKLRRSNSSSSTKGRHLPYGAPGI